MCCKIYYYLCYGSKHFLGIPVIADNLIIDLSKHFIPITKTKVISRESINRKWSKPNYFPNTSKRPFTIKFIFLKGMLSSIGIAFEIHRMTGLYPKLNLLFFRLL